MKTIYIDLDGVICDLNMGIITVCDGLQIGTSTIDENPFLKNRLLQENVFTVFKEQNPWKKIQSVGYKFWENLEVFPWANDLISMCSNNADHIAFLTSPGNLKVDPVNSGIASHGKTMFVEKNFPDVPLIITKSKHILANQDTLLIDDTIRNIEDFRNHGGYAFHFPHHYTIDKLNQDQIIYNISRIVQ